MSGKFKKVTTENWLEPDPLYQHLVKIDMRDGAVHPLDGSDWIVFVNNIEFSDHVPEEVSEAFWFAVGSVGYSYFYWPLLTLVAQQTLRIADFAVDRLFGTLAIEPKPRSFARRLKVLHEQKYLDDEAYDRWEALRGLRNRSTHPEWQQNWGHAMSLEMVKTVADAISALPWPTQEISQQK